MGHTHAKRTAAHTHSHTPARAQTNTFPQRGFAHSRTEVTSHHEPNEARVARRGEGKEERWRDGWSGTTEQYVGG